MIEYSFLSAAMNIAYGGVGRCRTGAVATGRRGFAFATNAYKKHPRLKDFGYPDHCGQHAEFRLATMHPGQMEGATVYVARLNKRGESRLAKPCVCCEKVLRWYKVRRVIYTTNTGAETLRLR